MSNPSETGENRKLFSGRQLGKALEKSSFVQTCTLLSQFLREKRNLGDVSFAMLESRDADQDPKALKTTCNLLTKMENSTDYLKQNSVPTMDFLPQFVGAGSTASIDNPSNEVDFRKPANREPATAQNQMTIFYGGKVVVFNDFPAEKAEEIMTMATNGISPNKTNTATNQESKSTDEHVQRQPQANATDMPLARRNSLHRFLEKRKDRATASAPYQVNPPPQLAASSSKNDMSSESIDLNL